jgi:hypothetical protein
MFLSAASRLPFDRVSQPRSLVFVTMWPVNERAIPRGVTWSKRMRMNRRTCIQRRGRCVQTASSEFQHSLNLLPRHIELIHDFVDRGARLKVLENSGNRHPCIAKHPRAAQSSRHAFNRRALRPIQSCHGFAPPNHRNPIPQPVNRSGGPSLDRNPAQP